MGDQEWGFRLFIGGLVIWLMFCVVMLTLTIVEVIGIHALWLFIGVPAFLFAAWTVGGIVMRKWDN